MSPGTIRALGITLLDGGDFLRTQRGEAALGGQGTGVEPDGIDNRIRGSFPDQRDVRGGENLRADRGTGFQCRIDPLGKSIHRPFYIGYPLPNVHLQPGITGAAVSAVQRFESAGGRRLCTAFFYGQGVQQIHIAPREL